MGFGDSLDRLALTLVSWMAIGGVRTARAVMSAYIDMSHALCDFPPIKPGRQKLEGILDSPGEAGSVVAHPAAANNASTLPVLPLGVVIYAAQSLMSLARLVSMSPRR